MYSLYLEECAEKPAHFKINENSYRHMFCAQFNIGFGEPRSDTCSRCDSGEGGEEHVSFYKAPFKAQNDR